jgi:sirohydrochlorin cobaltochelatase
MARHRLPGSFGMAERQESGWSRSALVLCAHGIRGGPGSALDHADAIARRGLFAEVHACAHKGRPGLVETLARVKTPALFLLPLLMAEAYTLRAMLRKLEKLPAPRGGLRVCRPIGVHPRFADLIARRGEIACAKRGYLPAASALVIAAHGTTRDAGSGTTARAHAEAIRRSGGFAEVATAFLDEPPTLAQTLLSLGPRQCVVVGMFVDQGEHGEEDIPELLAPFDDRAVYAGPVGTDPAVIEFILDQVRAAETGRGDASPASGPIACSA